MEEVYWIAGTEFYYPPEELTPAKDYQQALAILKDLLASIQIHPGKVNEIHWQTDAHRGVFLEQVLLEAGFPPILPAFSWECGDIFDHYLLQSAARTILVDDARMIILGQQVGCATSALMLASPDAVGLYNLNPIARLSARFSFFGRGLESAQIIRKLEMELIKRGFDPSIIQRFVFSEPFQELRSMEASFPCAVVTSGEAACPGGAIFQANNLVRALQVGDRSVGLLLGRSRDGHFLASVFEKV